MTTMVEPFAPWVRELNRMLTSDSRVGAFMPPADVVTTDGGVTVYMDVPGISGEQLEIELENDMLAVRGERPYPYADREGNATVRLIERGFGRFERSLRVPRGLDPNAVEASLANGELTIRVPKPESLKPQKIEIKAEPDQHELQGGTSG